VLCKPRLVEPMVSSRFVWIPSKFVKVAARLRTKS
jgi:hypothetical protein